MARKKFHQIDLENLNTTIPVFVEDVGDAEGKILKFDTTRLLKGKSSEAKLRILKDGEKPIAKFFGFKILPFYMKRVVRKGTNYIEDSFLVEIADAQIRVKPFLDRRKKVHRSVRKELRNRCKSLILDYFKNKKRKEIFNLILKGEIQKFLNTKLRKVYPLAFCDIRGLEVKKTFKAKTEAKKQEKPKIEKIEK